MMRRIPMLLALIAATLTLAFPAAADDDATPPAKKRELIEQRMQQVRARVLREHVGLTEAKAKRVEAIMDRTQKERRKLRQETRRHRRKIARLLRRDADDQAAYRKALVQAMKARKRAADLEVREFEEIAKVLTPKEHAKLLAAHQKVRRKLRQLVRKHGGRAPPSSEF